MKHKLKLARFDPEYINQQFFPDIDPQTINNGRCWQWAYLTYHTFQHVELWSMGSHAFVRYKRKFYDAERITGEKDYKDLPATNFGMGCGCNECRSKPKQQTVPEFQKYWESMRKFYNISWLSLEQKIKR